MKKTLLIVASLLFGLSAFAQQALFGGPQTESPVINADGTVTFRIQAPKAVKVEVTGDFLPTSKAKYPVLYVLHGIGGDEDAWVTQGRAICGLSMGGFHTLYITLNNPDMFNYSGMYSAAIGTGSEERAAHKEIYENVDGKLATYFAHKPALLWIGIGSTDFLIQSNNEFRAKLDAAGYPYKYMETDGGHIWRNWRIYLSEFVPLLFK